MLWDHYQVSRLCRCPHVLVISFHYIAISALAALMLYVHVFLDSFIDAIFGVLSIGKTGIA